MTNKKNNSIVNQADYSMLLARAIRKTKEYIFTHPEYKLSFLEQLRLKYYLYLRAKGLPIAYITKHKEFYGLDFFVNKHVLVPRPETEMIVDDVLCIMEEVLKDEKNKILLIDVGTGSGCIPISIIKTLKLGNIKTIAIDISHPALRIAEKNAKKHNVKINFLHGNLLKPILKQWNNGAMKQWSDIIITANLPYLTATQFNSSQSIQREPCLALIADNINGLTLYEKLLEQIKQMVVSYKLQVTSLIEIDHLQSTKIQTLIKKYFPQANIEIKKDLASLDRLVRIIINNEI
jgi:release factor glutamine methyltransferase